MSGKDIYNMADKVVGQLDGEKLLFGGRDYYLTKSRKRKSGWRFYNLFGTHWRIGCKTYSNEIKFVLKRKCKYNSFDMDLIDIVSRLGDVFMYNSLFV